MAHCQYCGLAAGFLRSIHAECQEKNEWTLQTMKSLAANAARTGKDLDLLEVRLERIAAESRLPRTEIRCAIIVGFQNAMGDLLDQDVIPEDVEMNLQRYLEKFSIQALDTPCVNRFDQAKILRQLIQGRIDSLTIRPEETPFTLVKDDVLLWMFKDVPCFVEKGVWRYPTEPLHFGVSAGQGVYYKAGDFRGHPLETAPLLAIDRGLMGIGQAGMYFLGRSKEFCIPYEQIGEFIPFSNGLGIAQKDRTVRPRMFKTGDGWFTYNLVRNLAQGSKRAVSTAAHYAEKSSEAPVSEWASELSPHQFQPL